jgi:Ca-activated chloride channel family protein
LFAGNQLLLVGRYREGGTARVVLTGSVNGRPRTYTFPDVTFSKRGGQDFIPRLWATRQVGQLLKEISLRGENRELLDSIVALSVRYGIMTPYTSFLVDERQDILTAAGREELAAKSFSEPSAVPSSGAQAVADSQARNQLTEAERGGGDVVAEIRQVGTKAFVLRAGVWTDTAYDPASMHPSLLQFGSAAYFRLLADHTNWGKYFAVGEQVIVVLDGTPYQVGPDAASSQTPPEPTPQPAAKPLSPWEQFWQWFLSVTGQR